MGKISQLKVAPASAHITAHGQLAEHSLHITGSVKTPTSKTPHSLTCVSVPAVMRWMPPGATVSSLAKGPSMLEILILAALLPRYTSAAADGRE